MESSLCGFGFLLFCEGARLFWSPAAPASSARFCFCPLFPRPRSQSALPRRGRGRLLLYFAGGSAPGTPGLSGARHWLDLPVRHSAGGLLSCLPANPAFSLLSCPHPPAPLPSGKGETKVIFMQGASPLASPGLSGTRHLQSLPPVSPAGACPGGTGAWWALMRPAGGFSPADRINFGTAIPYGIGRQLQSI